MELAQVSRYVTDKGWYWENRHERLQSGTVLFCRFKRQGSYAVQSAAARSDDTYTSRYLDIWNSLWRHV